jgi:hypothetical protein
VEHLRLERHLFFVFFIRSDSQLRLGSN